MCAKVVRCAVASAVCHFHSGARSRERVMKRLGIPSGEFTKKSSCLKDREHVGQADRQMTDNCKRRRQAEQVQRTRRKEALCDVEGTTYEAGGF